MWEKRDCLRAGESVKFGDWDIFKTVIVITGESTKYATAVAGFTTKYRDQLFTSKTDPILLNCMLAGGRQGGVDNKDSGGLGVTFGKLGIY